MGALKARLGSTSDIGDGAPPSKLNHQGWGTELPQALSHLGGSTGHSTKLITTPLKGKCTRSAIRLVKVANIPPPQPPRLVGHPGMEYRDVPTRMQPTPGV